MGLGMGRTGMGSTPASRSFCPFREKAVGRCPTTRWGPKAPDPMSGFTAYQTRRNLGSYLFYFQGSLGGGAPMAFPHLGQLRNLSACLLARVVSLSIRLAMTTIRDRIANFIAKCRVACYRFQRVDQLCLSVHDVVPVSCLVPVNWLLAGPIVMRWRCLNLSRGIRGRGRSRSFSGLVRAVVRHEWQPGRESYGQRFS